MAKKNNALVKGVEVGAGLVAMVATIAGIYFLYGSKKAKQHRKQVKAWTLRAKGEILEKLENLKEVNEEIYHKIVKEVSDKYQIIKSIDKKDVMEFADELKSHWKGIAKEITAFHKAKSKK